ncbi:RHS repeat-associated core domain-containing protein [Streptomyces sp. B146]|uniref:RHS repeat-associated core domain-containing protein n=2 Tax=Streptomyces TaxID=1883 RepID=UPI003298E058
MTAGGGSPTTTSPTPPATSSASPTTPASAPTPTRMAPPASRAPHPRIPSPQPYRYAGAYTDLSGLYKMGHRYYDPTLGRFTQPEPSGQEKKNPYLYANGDPINNTDLNGLLSLGGHLRRRRMGRHGRCRSHRRHG